MTAFCSGLCVILDEVTSDVEYLGFTCFSASSRDLRSSSVLCGYFSGFSLSQAGPYHQKSLCMSDVKGHPLDGMSAGFSSPGQFFLFDHGGVTILPPTNVLFFKAYL